ncbi:IscS subfamily cysteine desulfurase [Marinobacter sp.]|uniref:IscS subfamily cysteine desulfurase n=1 Tax=Marinobacter sp. TaxID=50741 RepID=UPI002B48A327|nr:IscS subfamily cysteine desulfurase [Marinobacter sp.]HKK55387.1 IscS subfamily cysteine desulfurase [Marinobacter sp.]
MKKPVYLDFAATTPVDPLVAEEMMNFLTADGVFGNPASRSHGFGWQAEAAVERARRQVANLIHADPREIVWTSGATESDNLAIKGVIESCRERFAESGGQAHIVTSVIEHKAVVDTCRYLERQGVEVTWLKPAEDGRTAPEQVKKALRDNTVLVSLMQVNNELGCVNDIAATGAMLRERGVVFHVDAAQAAGKLEVNVEQLNVDLLSLSAHKVYGPKGIGALYVRRAPDVRVVSQIHGGGHERGMRSGTLPTHQIVGMGKAFEIAGRHLDGEREHIEGLRAQLLDHLAGLRGVMVNGSASHRVPGIINISFQGVDAESLMLGLRDLAVSSGSACSSATVEPSFVLRGIGLTDIQARQALRFSLGRYTTSDEVEFAASRIIDSVTRLRAVR